VLTPAVSRLEAEADNENIRRIFVDGSRFGTWFFAPIVVGLICLGKPFLSLWVGPHYAEQSYPVLVILAISLVLHPSQAIAGRILYGVGRLRRFTRLILVQALANLILSVILAPLLGIQGVAWGTTVPFIAYSVINVADVSRYCGVRPIEFFRLVLIKPAVPALVLTAAWWPLGMTGVIATYRMFFIVGAGGTLMFAAAALFIEFGPGGVLRLARAAQARVGIPQTSGR
jgi:O-antigen/teichoic acid export membrane protein